MKNIFRFGFFAFMLLWISAPALSADKSAVRANTPPQITDFTNVTIAEDSSAGPISFTISDLETPAADLVVTGTASDTMLVPPGNIVIGGAGTDRTISITPAHDQYGTATIDVTVSDGELQTTKSFLLTVSPVVEPPANIAFTPGYESVTLHWNPNTEPDFLKYYVYADTVSPPKEFDSTISFNRYDTTRTYFPLQPGYTYYGQVVAIDTARRMSAFSPMLTYTVPLEPPLATTQSATDLTDSGATLHGIAEARWIAATAYFQYGLTTAYGDSTAPVAIDTTVASVPLSISVTGLAFGTTYHYRLVAVNRAGVSEGSDFSFTTTTPPPLVVTLQADSVRSTTAILHGSVNPNNLSTTVSFEYGTTTGYGSTLTAVESPVNGNSPVPVSVEVSGLLPNTLYHYRVAVSNVNGSFYGADSTFTTLAALPVVATGSADSVMANSAFLRGSVDPGNSPTTAVFEYGTTTSYGSNMPVMENPVNGLVSVPVGAPVTGLIPNTTYHYRLSATNVAGTASGADSVFTTAGLPPFVQTLHADNIDSTSAIVHGIVNPLDSTAAVSFEYGTTTAYGTTVAGIPATVSGDTATAVHAMLTGLEPNTLYHFRVFASNGTGTSNGADSVFSTHAMAPAVLTLNTDSVTGTFVKFHGSVNPFNSTTTAKFEYGTTTGYGTETPAIPPSLTGTGQQDVIGYAEGLLPNTLYHYRLVAENSGGTSAGADSMFTTLAEAPVVATLGTDSITTTTAFLKGSVDPKGSATTVIFQYGTTTSYGNDITVPESPVNGHSPVEVGVRITGLTLNTTYHYRIVGTNAAGTSDGPDSVFTTNGTEPTVLTLGHDSLTQSSAVVFGSVNPNNSPATVTVEYGLTTAYGESAAAVPSPVSGLTPQNVIASLTGLGPNTTYHYRFAATNAFGTSYGADSVLTTLPAPPAAPVLVSPPDEALNQPVNPLLIWHPSAAASTYRVQVSTDSGFVSIVADDSTVSDSSWQTPVLTRNTVYYWHVRAANPGGSGTYSEFRQFRTIPEVPSAPSLLLPPNGNTNAPIVITFAWDSIPGTVSYRLQVATDSLFTALIVNDSELVGHTFTSSPLAYFTRYYWHVQAMNEGGSSPYSSIFWFKTTLPVPELTSPPDDTTNIVATPLLTWNPVPNAAWYRLQVSVDSAFVSTVYDSVVFETSKTVILTNQTRYFWRVKAANAEAISDWSTVRKFATIVSAPSQVVLVAPADTAQIGSDSLVFVWRTATPDVSQYQILVARDSLFTNIVTDTVTSDTTREQPAALANGVYWWKVRAQNIAGWGPDAVERKFTVFITGVNDPKGIPAVYRLNQNYPNPFNPSTTIRYQLPYESRVRLEVYNVIGQMVHLLADEMQTAGYKSVTWNATSSSGAGLPSGIYFYRLTAVSRLDAGTKYMEVKKMLLVR